MKPSQRHMFADAAKGRVSRPYWIWWNRIVQTIHGDIYPGLDIPVVTYLETAYMYNQRVHEIEWEMHHGGLLSASEMMEGLQ